MTLGPGMNDAAINKPSAQPPSWHATVSSILTVPLAAWAAPVLTPVTFVI